VEGVFKLGSLKSELQTITDPVGWHKEREAFEVFLNTYFMDEIVGAAEAFKKMVARPATYTAVPTPDQIIAPGKQITIFGVKGIEEFRQSLASLPYDVGESFRRDFGRRASSLPLVVGYCSASGKYCATSVILGLRPNDC